METAATKNYLALSFGCLSPTRGEEYLLDQIKKKHDLWNKLVEKDREHREKVRQVMVFESETTKKIKELEEELNSLREEIKKQRKTKRTGKVDVSDIKARIEEIKPQLKDLKEKFKEERSLIFETRKQELALLEKERWAVVKELGKGSGLYWCNLEDVVNSYDTGRKKAKAAGGELRFHRWDGTGKVTVRFQKGLPVNEMFSCTNNLLQIDPVDKDAWHNPVRAIRRKKSRTKVRLRACSENKKPLFIELPVVLHREIPEDALIRTASVIREKVGMRYRYKLNLVLELLGENTNRILPALEGTAAIDLGWRMVKDGLRVAYLVDDKGRSEELILDNDVLHEFNKVKDLQSIRDNLFNETKAKLLELLKTLELPDEAKERTSHMANWRSQQKMLRLHQYWRENRLPGDDEVWEVLEYWRKREIHLYEWQENLRDQVLRRRKEIYRIFAAKITGKYKTIVLEEFTLNKTVQKPNPEEGPAGTLPANRNRFIAAISEFRNELTNACRKNHVELRYVPAENTTIICHKCGHKEKFDAAAQIIHTCSTCGELWDQDYNAAKNLLAFSQKAG